MTEEIKDETYFRLKEEYLSELAHLKQENAVLQAYKDVNEDFKKAWEEIKDKYFDYKTALEEINRRIQLENADDCLLDIKDIIDGVLDNESN